jgi:PDZ domain-containing protein
MEQSKIDATYVVLADLAGYPRERGVGALVEWVGIDCPAASEIDIGDTIVAVEGASISSSRAASRAIDAVPANDRVELRVVDRSGETSEISLMRRRCAGQSRPILGISTIDAFPIDVEIASGEIGGPSAGLMWALGLRDLLTPDDLTGGRLIAGTGTIRTDGSVGPIGGVKDKVSAAKRIGADVLLIPADNAAELKGIDAEGLQIVPVATYDEAVAFLEAL